MTVRHDTEASSAQQIQVFRGLSKGLLPTGLTAPGLRAFVVLLAHAKPDGTVDMLKPDLERLANVRIDQGDRFMHPLRESSIDCPADRSLIEYPWFDSIDYEPGQYRRTAGRFLGRLSYAALGLMSLSRWSGSVPVDVDEFKRLSTVGGIILYLRCRALLAEQPKTVEAQMRLQIEDVHEIFGFYCDAAISRKKVDGVVRWKSLSLSRVSRVLLQPGIDDIKRNADDLLIDLREIKAPGSGRGKPWKRVDIVFGPLPKRTSLRDLNMRGIEKQEHAARRFTSVDPAEFPKKPEKAGDQSEPASDS
ncbi:hypothetical protein [Devosia sp. SD17-2]|uniref:hypothetical protein n=1 Tax=Devosia sp. SD17-2 TaxID=2976459 RepID=UPI0023D85AD7|nr:hypothetical protein [Devosia sp. SD17-2]WEJ31691.1 hypothetical protein NYQ88_12330 [Devosia sp. SD17-2]